MKKKHWATADWKKWYKMKIMLDGKENIAEKIEKTLEI